jgi:hypothetical protein
VNLRHIVPALGLMALTSAPALAADAMPAVSFEGWVDTILSYSSDDIEDDDAGTEKDEEADTLRFSGVASLKANWKVTDALTARVNLWFNAGDRFNGTDDGATVSGSTNVNMREAYFAWALNDTVTWSMGKYIDHIGWIAAEPTGLYTVNDSLIGYLSTYGNDVIGTSIAVAPKDSPFSGSFHITNGYYTAIDATNDGPSESRENTDLGFGLDLTYSFGDKGNVNLDLAYDMHSDRGTADMGGDVFLIGANATIIPVKPLTLGLEVMYEMTDDSDPAPAGGDAVDRLQFLVLANYAIEGAPVPMSVTGMIQYIEIEPDGAADPEQRLGVSAALLTNPLTSSNFGLNFELGYWDVTDGDVTGEIATVDPDATGFVLSVEGLVTF